jgi:sialic acid synthase SpsE
MTPFIVAEMSANHLGSFAQAWQIVIAAAEAA